MCSLLAKRICSHLSSPSPLLLPRHHHLALLSPFLHQHLSTQPHKELPFIAHYLISSFGFSPDRALKVATDGHLTPIKSSDRPEAVIKFLRDTGLSDTQTKAVVSSDPILLSNSVDKTLKPNMHALVESGFSGKLLVQLIRYFPVVLRTKKYLPNLLFWKDFVGNCDENLFKIIPSIGRVMCQDVDTYIVPRINILKEYGLSNGDIVNLLGNGSRCMLHDLNSLRHTIEIIEELGISRASGMFLWGLRALDSLSKDQIKKRVELYKTVYGWSMEDVCSAFTKFPSILAYSEEKIKSNMDFLINEAKLDPRSIASQPRLLGFSLQKRLVPRHRVLSILAAKGLKINFSLSNACDYTEQRFLEKYVTPYMNDMPEVAEAYFAASDGVYLFDSRALS